MSHTHSDVDPGASATTQVAVDQISSVNYQRVKLANSIEGSTAGIGTESAPLPVKNARKGTSDYDSANVTVTNGVPTSVTAATIYPEGATLNNNSSSARLVTLTNAADETLKVIAIQPQSDLQVAVPGGAGAWVGLKAGADGTGVVLQVSGRQA